MPAANLEIVEIVGRGDLDRAAAHLGIGIFIGDDRDQPANQRQPNLFADEVGVARIFRMHCPVHRHNPLDVLRFQ